MSWSVTDSFWFWVGRLPTKALSCEPMKVILEYERLHRAVLPLHSRPVGAASAPRERRDVKKKDSMVVKGETWTAINGVGAGEPGHFIRI